MRDIKALNRLGLCRRRGHVRGARRPPGPGALPKDPNPIRHAGLGGVAGVLGEHDYVKDHVRHAALRASPETPRRDALRLPKTDVRSLGVVPYAAARAAAAVHGQQPGSFGQDQQGGRLRAPRDPPITRRRRRSPPCA